MCVHVRVWWMVWTLHLARQGKREASEMKFMLMFYANEAEWMALSPEEQMAAVGRIGAWVGQHAQAGRIVEGHRLGGANTATTVQLGPAAHPGEPMVTDGPFLEAKEVIGSYAIVEVADRDAAIALAKSWPGGGAVEIRPLAEG